MVTQHFVYVCNSTERVVTLGILYGYKGVLQVQYFSDLLGKTEIVEPSLERRVLCLALCVSDLDQPAELPQ